MHTSVPPDEPDAVLCCLTLLGCVACDLCHDLCHDQDALALAVEGFPELLTVRQNTAGQRASLAHAAAAGGALRAAPQLMVAMHARAIADGRAALQAEAPRHGHERPSLAGHLEGS